MNIVLEQVLKSYNQLQKQIAEIENNISNRNFTEEEERGYIRSSFIGYFERLDVQIMEFFLHSKNLYDEKVGNLVDKKGNSNWKKFSDLVDEYTELYDSGFYIFDDKSIDNLQLYGALNIYSKLSFFNHFFDKMGKFPSFSYQELLDFKNDYKEWYHWLIAYAQFIEQLNISNFNKDEFLFALKYFSISNFQCIKHIETKIPVDAQFIVFTGENGDGKTSILQALSFGLYNTKDLRDSEKGNIKTAIVVQYKSNENSCHNEIYNNSKFPTLYSLRNNIRELKSFAAYGASRLQLESVESSENQKLLRSTIYNLFYSNGILQNIETWLKTRLLKGETEKYNNVIALLVKLLPNVTAIEKEDTVDNLIFVYTEKGVKIPIEHLSSGHKSIVLMIGDMIIRLSSAQPNITNPEDFAGIVLIDELETHLHPKWQKEFPKILSKTFPKVQFIVTTHSAITLLGMPKNTVFFKVTRTEEEGTQIERLEIDVENLLPNQILTSPLFDLDSIKSAANTNVNSIRLEDNFQEIIQRDEVRNDLAKILKEKFKKTI